MIVKVLIANEEENVKVCEVYSDQLDEVIWERFEELKEIYGGANVCLASREVISKPSRMPRGLDK